MKLTPGFSAGAPNKFKWLYMVQQSTPGNPPAGVDLLYFKSDDKLYSLNSAGVETAISGGGSVSPLTTKGDIWGYSTVDARIPVGTNGQFLSSDSTQALGVKWVTPGSGTGNITDINSDATPSQVLAVGTAGTDFAIVDNGTGTHTFNLPTASASNRGALSTTDWSTFNGKLTTTLSDGKILVGNGSNVATAVTPTGDVTVTNAGVTAIGAAKVTNAMLAGGITAANLVGSDIATVGTVTAGTWSATTIALNKGGTGQTTKAAAFDALSPMTTSGDVIYGGASGTGTRLAKGTDGQVLTLASGVPSWATASGGGITVGTTTITSGTSGRVGFNLSGVYTESADFTFTNATSKLTVYDVTTGSGGLHSNTISPASGTNVDIVSGGGSGGVRISRNSGAALMIFQDTSVSGNQSLLFISSGANMIGYDGASGGDYYPPSIIYTKTSQMIGAVGSGPGYVVGNPNYTLELRATTSADRMIQFNNSDTGNASTDGTVIGVKATSMDFVIDQKEAANVLIKTSGTTAFTIDSSGVLQNNLAGSEATGAGSALLGTNSPATTNTAPYTWLKIKTSDGSTGYIPVFK